MRVRCRWLRDYVDVDLEPERLAERLTLLGMEVKGIERWGADWQNVVVGELLTVEKHPQADRLSLTRVRVGGGEPLDDRLRRDEHRRRASASRSPCPGAVLPGDRRIERTEKMGVVSNGMLCSGDELNLTGDADGILILPPDAPIGSAAGRPLRRRRPRRRRQAEPRRRAVARRARPGGRGDHRRPGPLAAETDPVEDGRAGRRAARRSTSATRRCARASSAAGSTA